MEKYFLRQTNLREFIVNRVDIFILELLTDQRTHHFHRAAGGGHLRHQMGMCFLHVLNPAGAAGGEHRKLGTGLQFFHELSALFHDGEVGGEVGVIYHVNTQTAECRDQLARDGLVSRHTEFLCHADTYAGSVLYDDLLGRVVEHLPHLGDLAVDNESTGGADSSTLAATDAARLTEHLAEAGGNDHFLAASGEVDRADILNFGAHAHAKAAEDALGGVSRDAGGGDIKPLAGISVFTEARLNHVVAVGILLQLASAALFTGEALCTVAVHQKLQRGVAALQNLFGMCVNDQTVARLHGAGSVKHTALVLHKAETAAAVDRQIFTVAQRRNVDSVLAGDFQNVALVGNVIRSFVLGPLFRATEN